MKNFFSLNKPNADIYIIFIRLCGIKNLFLLIIVFLFSSCSSIFSSGLLKTSPLYTGKLMIGKTASGQIVRWDNPQAVNIRSVYAEQLPSQMDYNRIYAWPLFYKNFFLYSIFWPLFEIDDVGWKLRPLISVNNFNKRYRILNTGWDLKNNSHYVFPFYIKNNDSFYSLPFSYKKYASGKTDYLYNYFLFAWYSSKTQSSLFFPLYYYDAPNEILYTLFTGWTPNGEGYIFPVYFYENKYTATACKKDYKKRHRTLRKLISAEHYILPPLGKIEYINNDNNKFYKFLVRFIPLFWYELEKAKQRVKHPKYKSAKANSTDRKKQAFHEDYFTLKNMYEEFFFLLPLAYYYDNHYYYSDYKYKNLILFPLYFYKKHKSLNFHIESLWILPFFVYKRYNNQEVSKRFLMISGIKETMINGKKYYSSFVLPFYVSDFYATNEFKINPKYKYKKFDDRNYPADYWQKKKKKVIVKYKFIFPCFFQKEYENKKFKSFRVFPFYSTGYDKTLMNNIKWTKIFPFYSYENNTGDIYKNYGLLYGTRDEKLFDKRYKSSYLIPLYDYGYSKAFYQTHKRNRDKTSNNSKSSKKTILEYQYYFPSFITKKYENGDLYSFNFLPFYSAGHSNNINLPMKWRYIFPFYFYQQKDKNEIWENYLCSIGKQTIKIAAKIYNAFHFLPFYFSRYNKDIEEKPNPKYKIKLFKSRTECPDDYFLKKEYPEKHTFIFPNYFSTTTFRNKNFSFELYPFFNYDAYGDRSVEIKTMFGLYKYRHSLKSDNIFLRILWYLFYYAGNSKNNETYLFPLFYSSVNDFRRNAETIFFPFFSYKRNRIKSSIGLLLWLYSHTEYIKKHKRETQFLWYLYYNTYSKGDKSTDIETEENTRILWELYHKQRKGDSLNIDIFPFISYSSNTKKSKFSFLYRLFSIEQAEKHTKIYLLFCPVWW